MFFAAVLKLPLGATRNKAGTGTFVFSYGRVTRTVLLPLPHPMHCSLISFVLQVTHVDDDDASVATSDDSTVYGEFLKQKGLVLLLPGFLPAVVTA